MVPAGEQRGAADVRHEHGFEVPRRRLKPIAAAAAVVLAAVVFLVWLMARGPDEDRLAERIAAAAEAALPADGLAVDDLREAAGEYGRALGLSPGNGRVLAAIGSLRQRATAQIGSHIDLNALVRAEELLGAAGDAWPGDELFSDTGDLRGALDIALREREIREEIARLLSDARRALLGDPEGGVRSDEARLADMEAALHQLRQALELDPENENAQEFRADMRQEVIAATRSEIDAGNPALAQRILDVAETEFGVDSGVSDLGGELRGLMDELANSAEVARAIDLGEQRLAADNLTTPADDSAMHHFRRALELDPGNARAETGLERVAERYVVLVRDAADRNDLGQARSLLSRLIEVAPGHAEAEPLQARIEAAEQAEFERQRAEETRQAALAAEVEAEAPAPPPPATIVADDEEGRLWQAVMNQCDEAQLRRYIDAYPAGRYIDEAWRRRSTCLAGR